MLYGKVFKFLFYRLNTEAVRNGRIDLQRFKGFIPLFLLGNRIEGAHIVKTVGKFYDYNPYILTHSVGAAGNRPEYGNFMPEVLCTLSKSLWELRSRGVADIIVDPGFGFGKSVGQNYEMLVMLREFAILDAPILVGVSRKSMITKTLGVDASQALNGTTALNMAALMGGAHILRVHDVREAVETVCLYQKMQSSINFV